MSDDRSPGTRKKKRKAATRRLTWQSRLRVRGRKWVERALGAEAFWSLAFVAISLLLIGSEQCGTSYPELNLGEVSARDVVAKNDLDVVDFARTDAKRGRARKAILDVWEHDSLRAARLAEALSEVFRKGRESIDLEKKEDLSTIEGYAQRALERQRYSESLERELTAMLRDSMSEWIVGSRRPMFGQDFISLLHRPEGVEETIDGSRYASLRELREVRSDLRRRA